MFWFQKRENKYNLVEALIAERAERIEGGRSWEGLRNWFLEKGYTLYESGPNVCQPSITNDSLPKRSNLKEPPEWPYAYYGGYVFTEQPLLADPTAKVCFAQDREGRHVVIRKLGTFEGSEEEHINRWLGEHMEEAAENHILPILDILEYNGQSFAVMPRWGQDPCRFITIRDMMTFIYCLLKSINFLHLHSIVHGDILGDNILVNHFATFGTAGHGNWMRLIMRRKGKLIYALSNFEWSMMLPPGKRRLPSHRARKITSKNFQRPNDIRQGELDFDPFIFEMGCIGILLCGYFQDYISIVPMLAPFLDKLTTDNLDERFTSSQALYFFTQMCDELTQSQLATLIPPPEYTYSWQPEKYDRWHGLPDDFVKEWGSFRAPMPTFYTRTLRRLCSSYWGLWFVQLVRRSVRTVKTIFV